MSLRRRLLVVPFLLFSTPVLPQENPPFEKVVVLSAGGLRAGYHLGAISGLVEQGWKPDVVVASCGSGLAATIVTLSNDPKEWRKIIESREMYEYLRQVQPREEFNQPSVVAGQMTGFIGDSAHRIFTGRPAADKMYKLNAGSLINFPTHSPIRALSRPLGSDGIRAALVAVKFDFDPNAGFKFRRDVKLFTPVVFTDADTARHLRDYRSPIGKLFPDGAISQEIEIYSDVPAYQAMRAAMSEPFLVQPAKIELPGHTHPTYFLSGPDLYPFELAKHLGKERTMAHTPVPDILGDLPFQNIYGVSWKTRFKQFKEGSDAKHWIDFSDYYGRDLPNIEPRLDGLKLVDGFPKSYEAYLKIIDTQWKFGEERARESLKQPVGSLEHIREKNPPDNLKWESENVLATAVLPARVLTAPFAALETFRYQTAQEGKPAGSAAQDTLNMQALPLLTWGGLVIATETFRRGYTDLPFEQYLQLLSDRTHRKGGKALVIDATNHKFPSDTVSRRVRSLQIDFSDVQVLRAENLDQLAAQMATLPSQEFTWVEFMIEGRGGRYRFPDGDYLTHSSIERLIDLDLDFTTPNATLVMLAPDDRNLLSTAWGLPRRLKNSSLRLRDLGNVFLGQGGQAISTARNLRVDWSSAPEGTAVGKGWRGLSVVLRYGTGYQTLRTLGSLLRIPTAIARRKALMVQNIACPHHIAQ